MHKFIVDQVTGRFSATIAEFWFKFISYVLVASVFHAAERYSGSVLISVCMWGSYAALYAWLKFEFEKAMYYVWPELEPIPGRGKRFKDWQFITANTLAPTFAFLSFGIGVKLSEAISAIQP